MIVYFMEAYIIRSLILSRFNSFCFFRPVSTLSPTSPRRLLFYDLANPYRTLNSWKLQGFYFRLMMLEAFYDDFHIEK